MHKSQRKSYESGQYVSHLVDEIGNLITCFDGTKLDITPIERIMSRTNKSLYRESHTLYYIKVSSISSQSNVNLSKLTIPILPKKT